MDLCAKCKKNPAILYITKMEGDKTTSEGLCLSCAKQLGIAPINNMIEQLGVSDEDIESLNDQMSEFIENMGGLDPMNDGLGAMMQGMEKAKGGLNIPGLF